METDHTETATSTSKRELRRQAIALRLSLSEDERAHRSRRIVTHLTSWAPLLAARVVGLFSALSAEPDTTLIHALCASRGQRTLYPRVARDSSGVRIDLFEVEGLGELWKGYGGIMEPEAGTPVSVGEVDVLIVPGLLFDQRGYRLGMGGGCYDRLLAGPAQPGVTVGIGFHEQLIECVPNEAHDVRLDCVVTDAGVFHRAEREEPRPWRP